MTTRVRVGPVDIRLDTDLSYRQLRTLLDQCAQVAAVFVDNGPEPSSDERPAIGFGAPVLERLPDDLAEPP